MTTDDELAPDTPFRMQLIGPDGKPTPVRIVSTTAWDSTRGWTQHPPKAPEPEEPTE